MPSVRVIGSSIHERSKLTRDGWIGMLMWGLALRHAWGVKKDEREGFRWLRRAAGRAVEGLEAAYDGKTHAGKYSGCVEVGG